MYQIQNYNFYSAKTILLIAFFLVFFACKKDDDNIQSYQYEIPENVSDGWETASITDNGIHEVPLVQMMDYINSGSNHRLHNILIVKNGKLVFEEYFNGFVFGNDPPGSDGEYIEFNRETDHFLASMSKSVTSVLVGIAVLKGHIGSLDDKVVDYFPEYDDILTGEKANITVKHLITMTAGLAWDENSYPYGHPQNDISQLFNSEDPIRYIFSKPLISTPGETFMYSGGATNVLGAVVAKASSMSLLDFGNNFLFNPINSEGGVWESFQSGDFFASGGIHFRARELCKIGYLFLNKGKWKSQQIISEEWITDSQKEQIPVLSDSFSHAYGYQWWIKNFNSEGKIYKCFLAAGWGGQYMFIFPEYDMIIEFTFVIFRVSHY